MNDPLESLKITLRFKRFIERYLLGSLDKIKVDPEDAILIAAIDKNENFVHVQFNELINDKKLEEPVVWNIRDWKSHYERYKQTKRISDLSRAGSSKIHDNIERLMTMLSKQTKIPREDLREAATLIILNKKTNLAALRSMGVNIEELSKEEKDALGIPFNPYKIL